MARVKGSRSWSAEEDRIVRQYAGVMSFKDIAELLPGRSALAVQLYMYRKRIPVRRVLARPIVTLMLRTKFGDETLFQPNRGFYERAGVSCVRFQRLAHGYVQPTQEEIIRLSRALNMQPEEMLRLQDAMQLDLSESVGRDDTCQGT